MDDSMKGSQEWLAKKARQARIEFCQAYLKRFMKLSKKIEQSLEEWIKEGRTYDNLNKKKRYGKNQSYRLFKPKISRTKNFTFYHP